MTINPYISFTIPTYNRAEFLDCCLEKKIQLVRRHNIAIYISDNASTDRTKEIVQKWQMRYPFLYYHCNESNLGMDGNFEVALNLPATEYVWLFGDTYKIQDNSIEYLLDLLSKNTNGYDALVFNLADLIHYPTKDYSDQNELLCDLAGIMSCVACLVYNKKIIANAEFARYYNTYFSLEAIIFDYIASKDFTVHWAQTQSIQGLQEEAPKAKKNWSNGPKMLEIGVESWVKFICSLPASYSLESKFKIQKSFGKVSGLLSYKGLLLRRADEALTLSGLKKYYRSFLISAGVVKFLFAGLLCLLPAFVFQMGLTIIKKLKK